MNRIIFGDNLPVLQKLPTESVDLVYIDPPFNTGKNQKLTRIKTVQDSLGDRQGYQGKTYKTIEVGTKTYQDTFDFNPNGFVDVSKLQAYEILAPEGSIYFLEVFLRPRLEQAKRILKKTGSLYFHIDYREVHYCKLLLDSVFGRENFMNEIIWAYDFGGRARSKWPAKHDNILFYVKDSENYVFNANELDREEYMAPGLVGKEKAKKGKLPTDTWFSKYVGKKHPDVWWQTIVPTNSKERWGYPTQKPRQLLDRIIKASTHKGDVVLDFFAGSGTTGRSAFQLDRKFVLVDNNLSAMEIMAVRFLDTPDIDWMNFDPKPFQKSARINAPVQKLLQTSPEPVIDPEFRSLASAASSLQSNMEEINDFWKDSPFEWVLQLPSRKKGKFARELLMSWFSGKGINFVKGKDSSETIAIEKLLFAIKFSTLWSHGAYMFQQIRPKGYDFLICFGLSPSAAHCWILDKKTTIKNSTAQHRGEKGAEYWFAVNPKEPPEWTQGHGGSMEQALRTLRRIVKEESQHG
jgi:site-specific DNA-methyltransferase (adenine-specific)